MDAFLGSDSSDNEDQFKLENEEVKALVAQGLKVKPMSKKMNNSIVNSVKKTKKVSYF